MSIKKVLQNDFHAFLAYLLGVEKEAVPFVLAIVAQFRTVGWAQLLTILVTAEKAVQDAVQNNGDIGKAISEAAKTAEATAFANASLDAKNALYTGLGMLVAKTTEAGKPDAAVAG